METSQLAAWPPAQHTEVGDEELERIVLARLRDREARLAAMDEELRSLQAKVAHERQHVDHLRAVLADVGRVLPEVRLATEANNDTRSVSLTPKVKEFVAGNRSPNMPERRQEYVSMSLAESARQILGTGETLHTNDIARAIFRIENDAQLRLVNATMRSTLAVGVNKGHWERGEESGTFRMRRKEEDGRMGP